MKEIRMYNCGGFALGTEDWYIPSGESFEVMVSSILEDFQNCVRQISDLSEVQDGEYPVLFKTDQDNRAYEFHFMRCIDGVWYEKCGSGEISKVETERALADVWYDFCWDYTSPTAMFAVKSY